MARCPSEAWEGYYAGEEAKAEGEAMEAMERETLEAYRATVDALDREIARLKAAIVKLGGTP